MMWVIEFFKPTDGEDDKRRLYDAVEENLYCNFVGNSTTASARGNLNGRYG